MDDAPRFPLRLVGIVATLLSMVLVLWLATRRATPPATTQPAPAPIEGLSTPPPADLAGNPRAAQAYVLHETCVTQCTAQHRECVALSGEEPPVARCTTAQQLCELACPPLPVPVAR